MARIEFTPEIIDALADQLKMFKPDGLNDDIRADLTDRPFLAIDPANATEIDDAIRVTRHRSGSFTVEVAIADASQVIGHDQVIDDAVDMRASSYDLPFTVRMLPKSVTTNLNLEGYTARALVVSRHYTRDLEPADDVSLRPASITVNNVSYQEFGQCSRRAYDPNQEDPMIQFQRKYRQMHGREYISPRDIGDAETGAKFAYKLVATYMVLANIAVANWAEQCQVPILFRNFDPQEYENRDEIAVGTYSTTPNTHAGIKSIVAEEATYTHATSPLRRAVDLVNHLQIGSRLGGLELPYSTAGLDKLSQHFNDRGNELKQAA